MSLLNTIKSTHLASFGRDALAVLGPKEYTRLILTLLRYTPMAMRNRAQAQMRICKSMGQRKEPLTLHFKGKATKWDTAFMDKPGTGNPSFAVVQEMAIRDAYFKHHPGPLPHFASAIDLGGNLGLFTMLIAPFADKVVTVETDPAMCGMIRHNLNVNNINHASVENAYIGGAGMSDKSAPSISLQHLINKHNLTQIGFIKIDIEGSEFELFEAPSWLAMTSLLSMEVHLHCGDIRLIKDKLASHGFQYSLADGVHFHPLSDDDDLKGHDNVILYARKKNA
jgi:hypothetical protein